MSAATITTPITEWFGIKHPIILAGMNVAAGPALAAAVTNTGGLGVIGGVGYTPKILRSQVSTSEFHLEVHALIRFYADTGSEGGLKQQGCPFWGRSVDPSGWRKREEDEL
jgi:NAD(P)H-dependent flavin oxidoreductase YrpB (nitropropane dioxygenase family)